MEETIKTKLCKKCNTQKPLTLEYFFSSKRNKTGFYSTCKVCKSTYVKEYYRKNKEKRKKYGRENYWKNIERYKLYNKKFYNENIEYNKKRVIEWTYNKLENDEVFKLKHSIRALLRRGFNVKSWSKKTKTQEYIGCNWETFKEHIESQFTEGMSWDNKSEWHYDHYYPLSLAQTHEDMFIFNHYTNFQPLWVKDNLSKSDKVPDGFEGWYDMMTKRLDTHSKV